MELCVHRAFIPQDYLSLIVMTAREALADYTRRVFSTTDISSLDAQGVQPKRTLDLGCGMFTPQVHRVALILRSHRRPREWMLVSLHLLWDYIACSHIKLDWITRAVRKWRNTEFVGFDISPVQVPLDELDDDACGRITWVHGNLYVRHY